MQRRQLCSFGGSASRRVALPCVSYSAAPVAPSADSQAAPLSDHPQNNLLSLRQLVRTLAARSGHNRNFTSAASGTGPAAAAASPLLPAEIWESARLSRLAGICYWPQHQLAERLEAEGMHLVAQGSNYFTSWYVCDADSRWAQSASLAGAADQAGSATGTTHAQPAWSATRRRLVLLRGMTWSSPDVDAFRVWSLLVRAFPLRTAPTRAQHLAVDKCRLQLELAQAPQSLSDDAGMADRLHGAQHRLPCAGCDSRHTVIEDAAQVRAWPTPFMKASIVC